MNELLYTMNIAKEGGLGDYVNEEELDPCTYRLIQLLRGLIEEKIRQGLNLYMAVSELESGGVSQLIFNNLRCEYSSVELAMIDFEVYRKWIIQQAASKVNGLDPLSVITAGFLL